MSVATYLAAINARLPAWFYLFGEASGPFVDSSTNAVTNTEVGTLGRGVTGPVTGALGIHAGAGDGLTLDYTSDDAFARTIGGYFRTTTTAREVWMQNRGGAGESGMVPQIAIGNSGGFGATAGQLNLFFNATSTWIGIHTTGTYNDGEWHEFVGTWEGGGTVTPSQLKLYVDGLPAATANDTAVGSWSAPLHGRFQMTLFKSFYGESDTDAWGWYYLTGAKSADDVADDHEAALSEDETPAVAWDVYRIVPPGDDIEFLATLDDITNKSIRPVKNAPGSAQFTINKNSPHATAAILAPGNLVKVRYPAIHSDYIFAFFLDQGDFTLVSPDEEGGEEFTFGGKGALDYWTRAIWLSSGFVIPWWPDDMEDPPAGAIGLLRAEAQRMAFYDVGIVGGKEVITDQDFVTVAAYDSYYDRRKTLSWPVSEGGPRGFKRHLVHFMAGEPHDTRWVHPSQNGVTDIRASFAIGDTILLSDIGDGDVPGQVIKRMYDEGVAADRPAHPIPLMSIDFDDTDDSSGDAWNTTDGLEGVTASLGETYLDTIARLLALGVIDVEMGPDLDMHAYNSQGRDLTSGTFASGKVRFEKGVNIADELRRELEDQPVGTFVEVVGTENAIGQAELPDAAARVTREIAATGDTNDTDALEALGLAGLEARLIRSDAIGFRIATGTNDASGLYLPGPDYSDNGSFWLGDVIRLHTGSGEQDFDEEDLRVYAITISEDDAGNMDVTVEVGSILGEAERRLYGLQPPPAASFTTRSQFTDTEAAEQPDLTQFVTKTDGGLETVDAHGATGATETIDLASGNWHSLTLNADCAITVSGFTAATGCSILVKVTQDGTGGWAITWDADIIFAGDDQPAQGVDEVSWFVLASDEGDGTIYGFPVGGGSGSALTVKDEGSSLDTAVTSVDVTGAWGTATNVGHAVTLAIPARALDDLTDATIATPATGDRLRYSGSAWVNSPLMWVPVMVEDAATGLWYVVVTGDGDAVMTEV